MLPRLFFPYIRINRNRLLKKGRLNSKTILLGLLGLVICVALYLITWWAVGYFHAQSELGIILSMKIFQMAWITIFAMLIFSSMIMLAVTTGWPMSSEISGVNSREV